MLTINGLSFDSAEYSFWPTHSLRRMAGKRLGGAQIPGRSGVIPSLSRMNSFEANEVILDMSVGSRLCAGREQKYHDLLDLLFHSLSPLAALLDLRMTFPDGSVRQAFGRVHDMIAPQGEIPWVGEFKVAIELTEPFWQDVDPQVFSGPASAASPHNLQIDTLTGATAPIEDAIYLVHGPAASGVRLSCPDTGGWVRLNRALDVGEVWRINSDLWTSEVGTVGMGFEGSATSSVIALTEFAGSGARLLTMQPTMATPLAFTDSDPNFAQLMEENRVCNLVLTGTGFGASTKVQVKARRKFL